MYIDPWWTTSVEHIWKETIQPRGVPILWTCAISIASYLWWLSRNNNQSAHLISKSTPNRILLDDLAKALKLQKDVQPEVNADCSSLAPFSGRQKTVTPRLKTQRSSSLCSSSLTSKPPGPPIFARTATDEHPGFACWCDIEASLFRVYIRGRVDDTPVIPPYNPRSRRGKVDLYLQVTNATSRYLQVFWVNFKGAEAPEGKKCAWTCFDPDDLDRSPLDLSGRPHRRHYPALYTLPCYSYQFITAYSTPRRSDIGHASLYDTGRDTHDYPRTGLLQLHRGRSYSALSHRKPPHVKIRSSRVDVDLLSTPLLPGLAGIACIFTQYSAKPGPSQISSTAKRQCKLCERCLEYAGKGNTADLGLVEHGGYVELGTAKPLPPARIRDVSKALARIDGLIRTLRKLDGDVVIYVTATWCRWLRSGRVLSCWRDGGDLKQHNRECVHQTLSLDA